MDHEQNLPRFLDRCKERHVRLNTDKFQVRQTKAPLMGHVGSGEGAIVEIPEPEDASAVQRLVGMVTYLSKFVTRLSEIMVPLRANSPGHIMEMGTGAEDSIQTDQG